MGQQKSHTLLGGKNHITSWGKKNHATSWDKTNHATSWDKKNHTTSWDKKIMPPLRTQKITQPLGKKYRNLSGKITLSIGPIASKIVQKAPNYSKWHQICRNLSNGYK